MKTRAKQDSKQLVILTGLSGSGKSTVLKAFEDMGFYCVDNMPVELIPIFAELHAAGEGDFSRAALLVDAREGAQLQKLPGLLTHLRKDHPISLVFLEAQTTRCCGDTAKRAGRTRWEKIIQYAKVCCTSAS